MFFSLLANPPRLSTHVLPCTLQNFDGFMFGCERDTRLNCVSPPGKYLRPVLNGIKSISIQLTSFPNWFLVDCSINIQLFPIFTPVHSMRSARKIVSGINQTRFVRSNYEAIVIETAATWNINFHPFLSLLSPSILAGVPFAIDWMLSSKWSLKENFPLFAFSGKLILFTFEGEV